MHAHVLMVMLIVIVIATVNQAVRRVLMLLTFMVNGLVETNFNTHATSNFHLVVSLIITLN